MTENVQVVTDLPKAPSPRIAKLKIAVTLATVVAVAIGAQTVAKKVLPKHETEETVNTDANV